jgi:hypothetical protein
LTSIDGCVPDTLKRRDKKREVVTTNGAPEGWVSQIKQAWLLPPFLKQLQKHQREQALLEKLGDCLDLLYQDPRQPGLHLETLHTNTTQPVLSARIDRSNSSHYDSAPGFADWAVVLRKPGRG